MDDKNNTQDIELAELLSQRKVKNKPSVAQVCVLYSISVILLLFIASRAQRNEFYSGILITEFILILLPPVILLAAWKFDIKSVLRLNKVSLLNLFLTFCIMLFTIPVVNVLNALYYLLIKHIFGRIATPDIPVATDAVSLLVNIFAIGVSAGICEEILFRGVIQRGFERFGAFISILMTSVLFGLWHSYFPSFLGTALLGAMIGFIVYRTNSLYSGMFAHFTNNSLAVLMGFVSEKIGRSLKSAGLKGIEGQIDPDAYFNTILGMQGPQLVALVVTWTFIVLFCGAVLSGLLMAFIRTTSGKVRSIRHSPTGRDLKGLIWLLPGFVLIGFVFFVNALTLKDIKLDAVEFILKIMGLR